MNDDVMKGRLKRHERCMLLKKASGWSGKVYFASQGGYLELFRWALWCGESCHPHLLGTVSDLRHWSLMRFSKWKLNFRLLSGIYLTTPLYSSMYIAYHSINHVLMSRVLMSRVLVSCVLMSVSWCPMSWCPVSWCPMSWCPMSWCPVSWCPMSWCPVSWCPMSWCPMSWWHVSWCPVFWCHVSWCPVSWCPVSWCLKCLCDHLGCLWSCSFSPFYSWRTCRHL